MSRLLFILSILTVHSSDLVERIAQAETNHNPTAVGDHGKSRGAFQLSEAAWIEVSFIRRQQGKPVVEWVTGAHEPIAREYAAEYLRQLSLQFQSAFGRKPSDPQLIGLYQHGFKGMARRGFISKP